MVNALGLGFDGARVGEKVLQISVDFATEGQGIERMPLSEEGRALCVGKTSGGAETHHRRESVIMFTVGITTRAFGVREPFLSYLMHDWLNVVVIEVHLTVDVIEETGLAHCVQA